MILLEKELSVHLIGNLYRYIYIEAIFEIYTSVQYISIKKKKNVFSLKKNQISCIVYGYLQCY